VLDRAVPAQSPGAGPRSLATDFTKIACQREATWLVSLFAFQQHCPVARVVSHASAPPKRRDWIRWH
ncbi:MAG TPA: hypothetical protein PKY50_16055, partial [Candidatus Competibacter sp.]|nr:hypothetical protein [Candidatus Competibacter sp.]